MGEFQRPWDVPTEIDYDYIGPHTNNWSGYPERITKDDSDTVVTNSDELYKAIREKDRIVWLERDTTFNVDTHSARQRIAENVTLASDGALIEADEPKSGVFQLDNPGIRITGLRFKGNRPNASLDNPPASDSPTTTALRVKSKDIRIDNCEFWGHTNSAIFVGWNDDDPTYHIKPIIHHNIIRDNVYASLGYGIVVYSGTPFIEYNYFDGNRHGIAAGGKDSCSYIAANNLHGPNGLLFQFEMHHPGGNWVDVRNNEFRMEQTHRGGIARAYAQRGIPNEKATVEKNWIYNSVKPDIENPREDAGISQSNHGETCWVNVEFGNNHYGTDKPSDTSIGIQPLEATGTDTDMEDILVIELLESITDEPEGDFLELELV